MRSVRCPRAWKAQYYKIADCCLTNTFHSVKLKVTFYSYPSCSLVTFLDWFLTPACFITSFGLSRQLSQKNCANIRLSLLNNINKFQAIIFIKSQIFYRSASWGGPYKNSGYLTVTTYRIIRQSFNVSLKFKTHVSVHIWPLSSVGGPHKKDIKVWLNVAKLTRTILK
jgi:hypothetical protein